MLKILLLTFFFLSFSGSLSYVCAQRDTSTIADQGRVDMKANEDTLLVVRDEVDSSGKNLLALDTAVKKHNPRKATLRSAIIPGWGQAYNKKYWKIPIVYGALGTTAGVFLYNVKTYRLLRQAVIYRRDDDPSNDTLIEPRFRELSTAGLVSNRDLFRQNIDYSVLIFIVFWGIKVVDATVDAHLKAFDVSPDISLKMRPTLLQNNSVAGVSLVFSLNDKRKFHRSALP